MTVMSGHSVASKFHYIFYLLVLPNLCIGSVLDYLPFSNSLFGVSNEATENGNNSPMQKVPYEVAVTDEKFIEQAAKFTGISLSDLDKCQHRVVFKLQQDCHKLNDEDIAKLAVKLLNCQSSIEGRQIYPCTDVMPIRECTSNMDSDTWNSYLLMSNRARAVCYSVRQAQFRGLTELTVNKLMGAAHDQLDIMSRIKEGQFRLEQATSETLQSVVVGTEALKRQQDDIRQAQFHGQLVLEDNIRRLADEKQLILEGHEHITLMTKDVKDKLEDAAEQIKAQSEERKDNHMEILNDLVLIQQQAEVIFMRIEQSSRHMLEQSALAAKQYESTLRQLAQVNSTVHALVDVMSTTRSSLEEKLNWLSETLGGTDNAVDRLYLFVSHITYLILAMVSCSFLQASVPARLALFLMVPLNLLVALQQGTEQALGFTGMTIALIMFMLVQLFINGAVTWWNMRSSKKAALKHDMNNSASSKNTIKEKVHTDNKNTYDESADVLNETISDSFVYKNEYSYNHYKPDFIVDSTHEDIFRSPTPPSSRYDGLSRSRSNTPQLLRRAADKRKCCATTRLGTPCKTSAVIGRDFCHRHQSGTSVIQ